MTQSYHVSDNNVKLLRINIIFNLEYLILEHKIIPLIMPKF